MIRVIDADVLMESLKRWRDEWAPVNNGYIAINEVISNIEKMPTVDAVPVERIKEMIARLRRRRMNLDSDCVDEAWNLKMQIEALDDLLSEWAERKEE